MSKAICFRKTRLCKTSFFSYENHKLLVKNTAKSKGYTRYEWLSVGIGLFVLLVNLIYECIYYKVFKMLK